MLKNQFYALADLGRFGHTYVSDGSEAARTFVGIQPIEESTVSYISHDEYGGRTKGVTDAVLQPGLLIVGKITGLDVTTGEVIAYYAEGQMPVPSAP